MFPYALPVEPLFDAEQVCAMVPCSYRWLRNQQRYKNIVGEPVYMIDARKKRHRMYSATVVRNLRLKRLAQFGRQRNPRIAPYEPVATYPQGESQPPRETEQ